MQSQFLSGKAKGFEQQSSHACCRLQSSVSASPPRLLQIRENKARAVRALELPGLVMKRGERRSNAVIADLVQSPLQSEPSHGKACATNFLIYDNPEAAPDS